jgi:hypothetical protein
MRCLFLLLALLAVAPSSRAQSVTQLTGDIEVVAFPPSLLPGQFVSQARIRLLHEGLAAAAAGMPGFPVDGAIHDPNLPVAPGDNTFGNAITTPYAGPGLPPAGAQVYSVLLHFDPNLSSLPFNLAVGVARSATISFDRPILGVYVTSSALNATDAGFGADGVAYSTSIARDLEFNYDGDAFSVSPDRRTLSITMYGHNGGFFDQARILVAPAPAVPALGGAGLGLLGAALAALGVRRLRS